MSSHQSDEERIFHVARAISNDELRFEYLDQICSNDLSLRERVERLLQVHEKEQEFLKSENNSAQDETVDYGPILEGPGDSIHRYKLMEQIGEGGMGTVFVAQQERPLKRRVALKVIKPGMDSKAVIARFEAERQALALMDHPNIARVLDAGATDAGRPYFVMELVKGIAITDYCDEKKLTIRERMRLFMQVCHAIQHAHQKGIIHRDIKPSNVLVTEQDGKAIPKVIDFGVAKALNQSLTDQTVYTSFQSVVGTPLYMSPEQAKLSAVDVDTRSDVYSLGVLLYELLVGVTPFEKERLAKLAMEEACRVIREEDPPRPSGRISSLGDSATSIADSRNMVPKQLHQFVRGDLDWLVLKCLEKDRARRYNSPLTLATDVQAYLNNVPLDIRAPAIGYRLTKYVKRNRVAIGVAGIVFLSLAIGLGGTLSQLRRALVGERKLEAQLYNATTSLAFHALRVGDLRHLELLLEELADSKEDAFEHRLLRKRLASHQGEQVASFDQTISCLVIAPSQESIAIGFRNGGVILKGITKDTREDVAIECGSTEWAATSNLGYRPDGKLYACGILSDGAGAIAVETDDGTLRVTNTFGDGVISVTPAPDLTRFVTAESDYVSCYDESGKVLWRHEHPRLQPIDISAYRSTKLSMAIAVSNNVVASIPSRDSRIHLRDLQSGKLLDEKRLNYGGREISFNAAGDTLAITSTVGVNVAKLDEDRKLRFTKRIPNRANLCAFLPSSHEVACADSYGGVVLAELETGRVLTRVVHEQGVSTVTAIAITEDESTLIAGDVYGRVKMWDLNLIRPPTMEAGTHPSAFQFVAVSNDGRLVASAGEGRTGVTVWDYKLDTSTVYKTDGLSGVLGMAFSRDGSKLAAAADGRVVVWDLRNSETPTKELSVAHPWAVAFSPDATKLAFSGLGFVNLYDFAEGAIKRLEVANPKDTFISLDFSPSGRMLASGGGKWEYRSATNQGRAYVWKLGKTSERKVFERPLMVYSIQFAPKSGKTLAIGGLDPRVAIVDVPNDWNDEWPPIQELTRKSWWVTGLAFTRDESRLVTASQTGEVSFIDATTWKSIGTLSLPEHTRRVALTEDALLTASSEGRIRVWRAAARPMN